MLQKKWSCLNPENNVNIFDLKHDYKKIIWLSILCEKKIWLQLVCEKKSSFKHQVKKIICWKQVFQPPPPQIMKWSLPYSLELSNRVTVKAQPGHTGDTTAVLWLGHRAETPRAGTPGGNTRQQDRAGTPEVTPGATPCRGQHQGATSRGLYIHQGNTWPF